MHAPSIAGHQQICFSLQVARAGGSESVETSPTMCSSSSSTTCGTAWTQLPHPPWGSDGSQIRRELVTRVISLQTQGSLVSYQKILLDNSVVEACFCTSEHSLDIGVLDAVVKYYTQRQRIFGTRGTRKLVCWTNVNTPDLQLASLSTGSGAGPSFRLTYPSCIKTKEQQQE